MSKKQQPSKKGTKTQVEQRVMIVAEMRLKAYSYDQIIRYASENWNVGARQVEHYISRANKRIKASNNLNLDKEVMIQKARLEDLYQKNYNIQDYRECRQVMETRMRLTGTNAPEKLDVMSNGEQIQGATININSKGEDPEVE